MKKYTLQADVRTVSGRKVKTVRKSGNIPATVYGKKVKSTSVSVIHDDFVKVYERTGETGLIELSIGDDVRPVLVHNVQVHPVKDTLLHVEFRQVDLKEKVQAKVPLVHEGEAPATTQKLGVILSLINEIEVEALPSELPEKIIIDITQLAEVNQEIKVSDLSIPTGVTVLTDAASVVVKVGSLVTKEAEKQAEAEAAEATAAAQEAAPSEEGADTKSKEGEATEKPEGKPEDKKPEGKE